MIINTITKFLGSQLFGNLLLLAALLVALAIGFRQILISDVVEIFASPEAKQIINDSNGTTTRSPIIKIQNVGTRLVYLDRYVFNGKEYLTHGQILPPAYSQAGAGYWVDLPTNGENHASLILYYHDLEERYWKTEITADIELGSWKVNSFPRKRIDKPE